MASSPAEQQPARDDVEEIELGLLLEAVYRRYGFDFREYAPASLRRRVWRRVHAEGFTTISALQDRVHRLFYESLVTFGVLALGAKESIRFSPFEDSYEDLDESERMYKKVR